jgi:hypothetical protein
MRTLFKRMIKVKIDSMSYLVAFQRDFNIRLDQDIIEVIMGILHSFILSTSFDVLKGISNSSFFTVTQHTVLRYD